MQAALTTTPLDVFTSWDLVAKSSVKISATPSSTAEG